MLATVKSEIYYFQEFCIKNLKLNKIDHFDAIELDLLADSTRKFQPNIIYILGVRGGAVVCGTGLQAGRSRFRFPMV